MPRWSVLLCIATLGTHVVLGAEQGTPKPLSPREASPAVIHAAVCSDLRGMLSLDGAWQFAVDPELQGESQGWHLPNTAMPSQREIQVPGCWEAQGVGPPGLSHPKLKEIFDAGPWPANVQLRSAYRGASWYKREFTVPENWRNKQIWLKIGGVNCRGWFWVNGIYLGDEWTYCGSHKYNVTDLVAPGQKATVAILARNDVMSKRGESNGVRSYGGVFRSVELEATSPVLIDNVFVEPRLDQKQARVHIVLRNTESCAERDSPIFGDHRCALVPTKIGTVPRPVEPFRVEVSVAAFKDRRPAGKKSLEVSVTADKLAEWTLDVDIDPLTPWSPENPFLYTATVELLDKGKPIDGWVERFGIKKFEARGADLYLNNRRYLVRVFSDPHVYMQTICSPASREEHAKHLQIAKEFGFNYVRHHTHCEVPEYYEAADEAGVLVQPELPYYGERPTWVPPRAYSHMSGGPLTPKEDLVELVTHYRRYTSLAMYVGGNEGDCPRPLDTELYRLAKRLDPTRPWCCMDGGTNNSPDNCDVDNWWGNSPQVHPPLEQNDWPRVLHEYMNLGLNEDPRLEPKFTGPIAPNLSLAKVRRWVTDKVGLDARWLDACFDAGYRLQAIHHKLGIETARFDPYLDGYCCWSMVDMSPSSQCGVLDMFWERKWSTPEYFRQFNAATVVLACRANGKAAELLNLRPDSLNYTAGDVLELDWRVSHFGDEAISNGRLLWRLETGRQLLAEGSIDNVNIPARQVASAGRCRIVMPSLPKPVLAALTVELPATGSKNTWPLRIFPKFQPQPGGGRGLAASESVYTMIAKRYPGTSKLGTPAGDAAEVIVAGSLWDAGVQDALAQGKRVVSLSLPGYDTLRPGAKLGWWEVSNQTGTALADHPAWGDFPHEAHLDQGMFGLIDLTEKLDPGHHLREVEPIMVGIGRAKTYFRDCLGYPLGFNLHLFQAKVGPGRLLASGLQLRNDLPEAVYLLDQFLRYARSNGFQPKGSIQMIRPSQKSEGSKKKTQSVPRNLEIP
jgi:beta-galactosidase